MHRYDELERIYYKKKYKKIFLIIAFFVIVIFLIVINTHYHKSQKKIIFHPQKIKINKPFIKKNKKINKTTTPIKQSNKKNKNDFTKTIQELKFILPEINNTKEEIPLKKMKKAKEIKKTKKHIISAKKETNKTTSVKSNFIIKETSINNINILINRFKKNPNYDLAIMISKIFFDKNNLKKAQSWALKANEINPQRIDSWVIFANILIKEKKINKAREILKTYLNSYGQNDIIEKKLRSINEQ